MAKVHFTGLQRLDFVNRQGESVKGYKLFITFPDPNVMGIMADSKFLDDESFKNLGLSVDYLSPLIGKDIELEANIKGKVIGVKEIGK